VVYETGRMASPDIDDPHQVVAAMLVGDDAVLLCHRSSDRQWYPDAWDLPGGHIEPDETAQKALVRELREELGVTLVEPLGHHSFFKATEEFELRVWTTGQWVGSPSNCAPHEHSEIGWFTAEDVLSLQLADPGYSRWIAEALGSGDAVAGRQPDRE
jgi:8-oxo-dGTP diphosphatase